MKKKFIIVLFITLAGSLSLMAQTKRKSKAKSKKNTTKPAVTKADTSKSAPLAALPANNKVDSIKSVPDSDDGYMKSIVMTKARPFQIFEPSENNVKFYHRYKRDISSKDPRNAKFFTVGSTLIEAILQGVKDGVITPYAATPSKANPAGDAFTVPLTYGQFMGRMVDTVLVDKVDSKTGDKIGSESKINDFSVEKVVGYRIKEDVYYDKQRAKVETRIIGIAPLILQVLSNGDTIGTIPVAWLKYTQCRKVFAKMDVSDADHNMYDVSMDDMFLQRQFNAVIIEESNPKGLRIKDYMKTPEDQAKEAARIEKKLDDFKKNLWNYQTNITAVSVPEKAAKTKKQDTKKTKTITPPAADNNAGAPVKP